MKTEKENSTAPASNARVNERHWRLPASNFLTTPRRYKVENPVGRSLNLALAPTGLADLDILSTFTSTQAKAPVLFGTYST